MNFLNRISFNYEKASIFKAKPKDFFIILCKFSWKMAFIVSRLFLLRLKFEQFSCSFFIVKQQTLKIHVITLWYSRILNVYEVCSEISEKITKKKNCFFVLVKQWKISFGFYKNSFVNFFKEIPQSFYAIFRNFSIICLQPWTIVLTAYHFSAYTRKQQRQQ